MPSAIVRFRPTGPWRFGPDSGSRDRVDLIFHSDSLYAAVTNAMLRLDLLDEWLGATARKTDGEPEVCFSSLFPFQREHLFVPPPRSMWPPPPSTKIRYKSARFVPLSLVQALVAEQSIDENRWIIDGESQCMIPSGEGPFRIGMRTAAGIDRLNPASVDAHTTACIEFGPNAGLWTMVVFSTDAARERWQRRMTSAFRILADSGFGGERSLGWGRSEDPKWHRAPDLSFTIAPETPNGHWLLSLYAPAESDNVDWKTGNYTTITRTGRAESAANWGALKLPTMMIAEGSVIVGPQIPRGEARDVAPPNFPHPVYRSGFAVAIPVPWRAPGTPRPEPRPKVVATPEPSAAPAETVPMPPGEPAAPAIEPEPQPPAPVPEPGPEPVLSEPQPDVTREHEPKLPEPQADIVPEPEPQHPLPSPGPERAPTEQRPDVIPEPEPMPTKPRLDVVPEPEPQPQPHLPAPKPEPEPPGPAPTPETEPKPQPHPRLPATEPEPEPPRPAPPPETEPNPAPPSPQPEIPATPEPGPEVPVPTPERKPEMPAPTSEPESPAPPVTEPGGDQ